MRVSQSVVLVAALAVSLAACGKKKVETPPAAATPPPATTPTRPETPPPPPPPPPAPQPAAPTEDEIFAKATLEELNAKKPLADVYFAYDSVAITEEGRASLQKNLQWLNRWPSTKIMVEGHADSRGWRRQGVVPRRARRLRQYDHPATRR